MLVHDLHFVARELEIALIRPLVPLVGARVFIVTVEQKFRTRRLLRQYGIHIITAALAHLHELPVIVASVVVHVVLRPIHQRLLEVHRGRRHLDRERNLLVAGLRGDDRRAESRHRHGCFLTVLAAGSNRCHALVARLPSNRDSRSGGSGERQRAIHCSSGDGGIVLNSPVRGILDGEILDAHSFHLDGDQGAAHLRIGDRACLHIHSGINAADTGDGGFQITRTGQYRNSGRIDSIAIFIGERPCNLLQGILRIDGCGQIGLPPIGRIQRG